MQLISKYTSTLAEGKKITFFIRQTYADIPDFDRDWTSGLTLFSLSIPLWPRKNEGDHIQNLFFFKLRIFCVVWKDQKIILTSSKSHINLTRRRALRRYDHWNETKLAENSLFLHLSRSVSSSLQQSDILLARWENMTKRTTGFPFL